jgi:serpin B
MKTTLLHVALAALLACSGGSTPSPDSAAANASSSSAPTKPTPASASGSTSAKAPPARPADPKPTIPAGTKAELDAAAASNNAFGLDVFREVLAKEKGNVVLSPASLSIALTMTYGGAKEKTAEEMKNVLHAKGDPAAEVRSSGQLAMDLADQKDVKLAIANRLFGDQRSKFEPKFIDQSLAAFGAPLQPMDFQKTEEARSAINTWVEDRTEKLITNLIPEGGLPTNTKLVLVNAIYFLGDWAQPFEKEATRDAAFKADYASEKSVPTMNQTASFATAEKDGVVALELPYVGKRFAMTILMPKDGAGLEKFVKSFEPKTFDGLVKELKPEQLSVSLPKFKLAPSSSLALRRTLDKLGMPTAFSETDANFAGMGEGLSIFDVFHKGFLRLDEKGTEAAAATAVVVKGERSAPAAGRRLVIDRPFLFVLRDTKTGTILFLGRVTDPS